MATNVTTKAATTDATKMEHPWGRFLPTMKLMKAPREYYGSLRDRHGEPFRVDAINGRVVMTTTPEGAKEVFSQSPSTYAPFAVGSISALTGAQSLLLLDGEQHKEERKLLRPSFHGARMKSYAELMREAARRAFGALAPGERFVANDLTTSISLEVIARAILGGEDEDEVQEMMEAVDALVGKLDPILMFNPRFHVAPLGLGPWAKFLEKKKRAVELIDAAIARRRASSERGERGEDMVSMFVEARYEDGSSMTDEHIRSELLTMLVAGHETTSVALAWALYHLYADERVRETLREALDEGPEDPAARARIPYLKAVGDETLRLHPIVPDIVRVLHEPMVLRGVEVPAGFCVGVAITLIHHDPELYPRPDAFEPERFIERRYNAFEFMPFGGGHRRCIGAALANFELAQVVDVVLSEFEIELDEDGPVVEKRRNVTMGPSTGVRLKMLGRRE